MEYRARIPGGKLIIVKFDKHGKRTVEYKPPKKRKTKPPRGT